MDSDAIKRKSDDSNYKSVLVELEEIGIGGPCQKFELKWQCLEGTNDIESMIEGMKVKKPRLSHLLNIENLSFKTESEIFRGQYVEIGDNSPVKHMSVVKCYLAHEQPEAARKNLNEIDCYPKIGKFYFYISLISLSKAPQVTLSFVSSFR